MYTRDNRWLISSLQTLSLFGSLFFLHYYSEIFSEEEEQFNNFQGEAVRLSQREKILYQTTKIESGTNEEDAFESVGGLQKHVDYLKSEVLTLLQRPELFMHSKLLQSPSGILLYGPPGTGNTLLASCLAQTVNATFLSLNAADLQSKWVGESSKNVVALFSLARKLAPTVLFFDEFDGLFPSRNGREAAHQTEFITTFLSSWEGLSSDSDKWVLVIAATNQPNNIDAAALRRVPCRLMVPLPDMDGRESILKALLRTEHCAEGLERDLRLIAEATEGFSGSDLKEVCRAASARAASDIFDKVRFKKGCGDDPNVSLDIGASPACRPLDIEDLIISVSSRRPTGEMAKGIFTL